MILIWFNFRNILSGVKSTEYMNNSKIWPLLTSIEICFTSEEWGMTGVLKDLFQGECMSYGVNTGRTIQLE